ncbi:MAG: ABC transporter permease [Ilumatobacteraceae bacterium]
MKTSRIRSPLQIATFLKKEAVDVLHQPRLLLTLVIGPFLIMAIFGIGYRDTPDPFRTLFVVPADSPLNGQIDQYADEVSTFVDYRGVSSDLGDARNQLLAGKIDLIVTFPDDPLASVFAGERAPITVIHTRLDPIERTAISFASRLAVDQINGQVLATIVAGGQDLVAPAADAIANVAAAADSIDVALDAGDAAAVDQAFGRLRDAVGDVTLSARTTSALSRQLAAGGVDDDAVSNLADSASTLDELITTFDADAPAEKSKAQVAEIRQLIDTIQQSQDEFATVDPAVIVRPFRSEVSLAVDNVDNVTDWYAPAAVVLMLQQFGVAFGALSFVREKQLGIIDVFRVAPVNAAETLIGKYLAYLLIGGAIGAALTALVVSLLDVPIAAGVGDVAIVMGLSLFASIGLGFVISLASATDAQAVQYTMILLLASLFFSGFFLSIGQMEGVARWVGWLLPVTYGMRLLRDVMLRGVSPDAQAIAGLALYGCAMFLIALFGTRRRMAVAR